MMNPHMFDTKDSKDLINVTLDAGITTSKNGAAPSPMVQPNLSCEPFLRGFGPNNPCRTCEPLLEEKENNPSTSVDLGALE